MNTEPWILLLAFVLGAVGGIAVFIAGIQFYKDTFR